MATLDFYKSDGTQVKLSLVEDPANPGQYLYPEGSALGTPGTGEPAHAGGSTGVIGWLRDILAKIAAFGTSGVPSANVISVQGPPNQFGSITFTGNGQALTLNCEGMASATFFCRVAGAIAVRVEVDFGNGIWQPIEYYYHTTWSTSPIIVFGFTTFLVNQWLVASTKGAKQVRLTSSSYSVASTWDGVVAPYPLSINAEIAGFSSFATLPTVATVLTPSNCSVYYTDTTTPLAANATFTGSTRAMAAGNNKFTAEVLSDVLTDNTATRLQASTDSGSTWGNTGPAPGNPAGNIPFVMEANRRAGHYRVIHQNGATPQSSLRIISSQIP